MTYYSDVYVFIRFVHAKKNNNIGIWDLRKHPSVIIWKVLLRWESFIKNLLDGDAQRTRNSWIKQTTRINRIKK